MFKLIFFDGTEKELHLKLSAQQIKVAFIKNPMIYQVVEETADDLIVWEREQ